MAGITFKSQSGISILGALIGASLLGIVSVTIMQTHAKYQSLAAAKVTQSDIDNAVKVHMASIIASLNQQNIVDRIVDVGKLKSVNARFDNGFFAQCFRAITGFPPTQTLRVGSIQYSIFYDLAPMTYSQGVYAAASGLNAMDVLYLSARRTHQLGGQTFESNYGYFISR
jgi:hypothetical protein